MAEDGAAPEGAEGDIMLQVAARFLHHLADAIALVAHEVGSNVFQFGLQITVSWLVGQ